MIRKMTRQAYEEEFGKTPTITSTPQQDPGGGFLGTVKNLGVGALKGAGSTLVGLEQLGGKLGGEALYGGINKVLPGSGREVGDLLSKEQITPQGTAQKVGFTAEKIAEFAIPGTKVSKATQAMSAIPKYGARALTSGGVAAAQSGKIGKESAIAAGVELALPGVGKVASVAAKPVGAFMGRLFKGVGSGLSGASTPQIEAILKNPKAAQQVVKQIKSSGGANVLRKNSKEIVEGVSKIRQEARGAFKKGLEELAETDIQPSVFRENIGGVLNKYGSVKTGGQRVLQNVEFDDPKNIKRASDLINRLHNAKLDGKSLRKLADDIAESKFKIATSDERLAYNAFIKDLSEGLTQSVKKSTTKLDEINKAFSQDMQLAEEIQQIFGKVKFKNAKEILTVSQRLESLFNKKGLAPEAIDNFLKRIGIESTEFRAGEAARQMGELAPQANTVGTNPFEIVRAFTSAIVPPKMVRTLAIRAGIGLDVAQEIATKLSPTVRSTLVRLMIGEPAIEPKETDNKQ